MAGARDLRRRGRRTVDYHDCRDDRELIGCECRVAVHRAYHGMLASGAPPTVALNVAIRVYCYHHPEYTPAEAQGTVEAWMLRGVLH